jgi:Methionyl-tRNA formyltransferase
MHKLKTVLICHREEELNRAGLPRWLSSFTQLCGVVVLEEDSKPLRQRIRREIRRVGWFRFLDVLAFRVYYRLFLAAADRRAEGQLLDRVSKHYNPPPENTPTLHVRNPNRPEVEEFIRGAAPDLLIARCKFLLQERIFTLPAWGTFVMHPGICPEYRNAHGCFWALARRDLDKVGMTLLKIDKGVDTGPVYGYYSYPFDERRESHVLIQLRTVFENLDIIASKLVEIGNGMATPIDTSGRTSAVWGQPWLTRYLSWKWHARKRAVAK